MTQAFNLSQLANNLDSTGRVDATDGLVNAVPVLNGGTGASTAAAARTNLGVAAAAFSVPTGGIIMWSGAQAAIPSGWLLCDGANGTPDLRNRFVVGAGSTYAVGASGGSANSTLPSHSHFGQTLANNVSHTHTFQLGRDFAATKPDATGFGFGPYGLTQGLTGYTDSVTTGLDLTGHQHDFTTSLSGTDGTNANLPPYYALCYIMKS